MAHKGLGHAGPAWPTAIRAFSNTSIELVVGLPDCFLPKMACDTTEALAWVWSNIQAYLPVAKIAFVTVGNEVLTSNDTALPHFLLLAMESLHSALISLGLDPRPPDCRHHRPLPRRPWRLLPSFHCHIPLRPPPPRLPHPRLPRLHWHSPFFINVSGRAPPFPTSSSRPWKASTLPSSPLALTARSPSPPPTPSPSLATPTRLPLPHSTATSSPSSASSSPSMPALAWPLLHQCFGPCQA